MYYDLPKTASIAGQEFSIRYDFRAILDIISALNDPELDDREKALVAIQIFYLDWEQLPDFETAIKECFKFINGGEEEIQSTAKSPKLVDWDMDAPRIIPAVNRVLGYEVRGVEYDRENNAGGVHWFTFLSAYMEIGDCLFAQVVRIRDKLKRGKPLDKQEKEWYRQNRHLVDFKQHYTEQENSALKAWGV